MIEKMQFINITGPKNDIDRVVNIYLNKYEIHLENALSELNSVRDLRPFIETNPYKDILTKAEAMVKKVKNPDDVLSKELTVDEAIAIVTDMYNKQSELNKIKHELKEKRNHTRELVKQIEPFRMLDYDLRRILHFRFIKYRFGRISREYFDKFSKYIYDNLNTVFYDCYSDKDYIWGVYFAPESSVVEVDAIYSSLHFERIYLPDEYEGTPEESYRDMSKALEDVIKEIREVYNQIDSYINEHGPELMAAYHTLQTHSKNFDIRKLAALTEDTNNKAVFYILCGWMSVKDTKKFLADISEDKNVFVITDSIQEESATMKPPTKLKNPGIIKPFEMFVKMYGLPAYKELDPTIFVAITYSFLFGAMFGDVGQGLCLVIGGFLLYKLKKMNIAGIICMAGIFSTIFGFAYGSLFGFEDIIEGFWLKPMNNVMTVLIVAVAAGMLLLLISIVLNIINSIRTHDKEKLLFDPNGIAGLIVYGSIVGCVVAIYMGAALPGTIILVILMGLPLLAIFLKEPLTHLIEHKKLINESIGMFIIEAIVELFDVVLSYATNTISFLRVGAFALSHAGMMGVVLMLAGAENGGNPNWLLIVFGNIIVACMEGLIVGIQVLRLEYYEMFGRFYRGTGKEFKAFNHEK